VSILLNVALIFMFNFGLVILFISYPVGDVVKTVVTCNSAEYHICY